MTGCSARKANGAMKQIRMSLPCTGTAAASWAPAGQGSKEKTRRQELWGSHGADAVRENDARLVDFDFVA